MPMPDTSYNYYFSAYCGGGQGLLEKSEFDRFVRPAAMAVGDYITFEGDFSPFEDNIRHCICRIAELLFKNDSRRGIKSENTDGYSVTYTDTDGGRSEVRSIVQAELGNTGLLFLGVE